jgi:O-antigen ligase
MWRKAMYFEILLGFIFILVLSDNLRYTTDFAKVFKNAYIVILTAIVIFDRKNFTPYNRIFQFFLPFLLVSLIGLYLSPTPFTSAQKILSYLLLFFAVPQFLAASFRQYGPVAIKDLIFFGLSLVLIGFVMRYTDPGIAISHGGRFRAIFGNPNGLGIFCTLLLILTVLTREYFSGLLTKNDLRWLIITILLAIALSGSRTSILAALLFLVFVRFYRYSPFIGFIAFLGIAFLGEILSSNLVEIVRGFDLESYFRLDTIEEGSGRYIAWEFAWAEIQNHLWFGRGFAYDEWYMERHQDFLNILGHQGGVHNTYLIIWLNTGVVGLLLFLRAWLLLFIQGARNTPVAMPVLYLVFFSIALEPWLAASLNPFTILLLIAVVVMTDDVFQPYIRGELSAIEKPTTVPALA